MIQVCLAVVCALPAGFGTYYLNSVLKKYTAAILFTAAAIWGGVFLASALQL